MYYNIFRTPFCLRVSEWVTIWYIQDRLLYVDRIREGFLSMLQSRVVNTYCLVDDIPILSWDVPINTVRTFVYHYLKCTIPER